MKNMNLIFYWIFTGLITLWMTAQGIMFLVFPEGVIQIFESLGMSTAIIVPLGIAKILASIAIVTNKVAILKNAAYIGLGVDFIVAIISHLMAGDGNFYIALIALALLVGSYVFNYSRQIAQNTETNMI